MPPLPDSRAVRKHLRKFRLETAQEILRNVSNTLPVSTDIQTAHHIVELCDAYSLSTLANWLATKYGFPAYASFIESSCGRILLPLVSWPAIADQYPFDRIAWISEDEGWLSGAFSYLDRHLQARADLLGTLYEECSAASLEIDELGRPYIKSTGNNRSSGQFYTPPWVVRYCLEQVFSKGSARLISTIEEAAAPSTGGTGSDRMQFKVLDPACGCGNFLLGVVDYLRDCGMAHEQRLSFARQSLYGIEVDGRAASLCRMSLLIALSDSFASAQAQDPTCADSAIAQTLAALRRHVVVSDTIFAASQENGRLPAAAAGKEHWTVSELGGFDVVVGNPPYISHGSRNQKKLDQSLSHYLRRSYPEAAEYKIRTHSIFQDIALRYAAGGGTICLLLPDAFLTGYYYRRLRLRLLREAKILSLTEFAGDIIGDATVGRWCVACYQRRSPGQTAEPGYEVGLYSFSRQRRNTPAVRAAQPTEPARSYRMAVGDLVSSDCSRFELVFSDADQAVLTAVRKLPPLRSAVRGHTGIRSRVGQRSIISKSCDGETWRRGLVSGAAVTRHSAIWDGTYINVEPHLLFAGGFDPVIVGSAKLLVRQTADRVVAAYDESGLYHLNNVHSFSPVAAAAEIDLWYLDGLMNSAFWLYLYQLKSRESGRALAQIDIEMLEGMPLPARVHPLISQLARQTAKLSLAARQGQLSPESELILGFCERSIDRLVYDLYDLAAEDIEHIEQICISALAAWGPLPQTREARLFAEAIASGRDAIVDSVCDPPGGYRHRTDLFASGH